MLDSLVRVSRRVGRSTDSLHAARASTRTEWGKGKRGKPDDPPERRRLGSTAASDPTPDLGRPRRRDRRGSKTRAPGDPRTGALETNPARRVEQGRAERAAGSYQDPGLRRPSSQRVAATYCGGKIARRRRAGGGRRSPLKAPSARGLRNGKSQHARYRLPAGRRTESPQFDLRISARLAS